MDMSCPAFKATHPATGTGRHPEELVAEAGRLAARGKPSEAVVLYQRALAGIPDTLGVRPWFMSYLMGAAKVPRRGRQFVGGIYARLSACLCDLLRLEDALYAAEAARSLDPASSAMKNWYRSTEEDNLKGRMACGAPPPPAPPPFKNRAPVDQLLTVVVTSHFTTKILARADLSPPGIGLVKTTYRSALQILGPRLADCRKILCLDLKDPSSGPERAYGENIRRFASDHGFEFRPLFGAGLQKVVASVLRDISSAYVLMLEHDWEFLPPAVDLEAILDLFENNPRIHLIRFNKRRNRISNFDFLLERETQIDGIPLTRTSAYSNNPHILRREKFVRDWLPLCQGDPFCRAADLRNRSFGIEEPLFKQYLWDIHRHGFSAAHARWGAYLLGRWGDPERIRHLGE
jgi:hypothetical protein